ncbi:hypothetical protein NVP2275O_210 [Vibrio phage 2.275.O._10N.286.54.E11]|nr:hypothetical protein NVP2275O_210 [Vibrio phage 2.275.O._10N.286.54.E11]
MISDKDLDIKVKRNFCNYSGHLEEEYEYYDSVDDHGKHVEVKHGYYHMYSSDCPTFIQNDYIYRHNKLHGHQKEYEWDFENRLEAEGEFDNGVKVGVHKSYNYVRLNNFNDDKVFVEIRMCAYVNGKLHGVSQEQLEDGTVISEAIYNNGVLESMWEKDSSSGYKLLDKAFCKLGNKKLGASWDRGELTAKWEATMGCDDLHNEVYITKYEDYETGPGGKNFLRTYVEFDENSNATTAKTFYSSGAINEVYTVVNNPFRKLQTSPTNAIHYHTSPENSPGAPWFGNIPYLPDEFRRQGLQRVEYYENGNVKMANMIDGRKFLGEFRFYDALGNLVEHAYYHQGQDVTNDVLEIAECDTLDDISEEAEVFLTLQYGALLLTPKELLCPLK